MAKKVSGFRLNGKPFDARALPNGVRKVMATLDNLPSGDLLTTLELATKIGYTRYSFESNVGAHPAAAPYKVAVRFPSRRDVWGNPRTIRELRKCKEILA